MPSGRLSRLLRMGGMAANVASGMMIDGAARLAQGQRPKLSDLLLTPANAIKLTAQLSQLRGAAMKLGQLLSMDTGDMLPPELAQILARLRSEAQHMPTRQLRGVLAREWGADWESRFADFPLRPIAAASIGQVHRATTIDGRDLAIKVQYPGVRTSIDSDVDNVATLIRLSGLLPGHIDIRPLLAEAKRQLHDEADYAREGAYLERYAALLAGSRDFVVPTMHADLSTPSILAMEYLPGDPIESLAAAPQAVRDRVVTLMIDLMFREMFDFGLMQTDPNFANYRYDAASNRVILLDFGAARDIPATLTSGYRGLARAAMAGDDAAILAAALDIGLLNPRMPRATQTAIVTMVSTAMAPIRSGQPFDFADTSIVNQMREQGMMIAADRRNWHAPPTDTIFVHRKFGGVYLLATRLQARVDVGALLTPYLTPTAAKNRKRSPRKLSQSSATTTAS